MLSVQEGYQGTDLLQELTVAFSLWVQPAIVWASKALRWLGMVQFPPPARGSCGSQICWEHKGKHQDTRPLNAGKLNALSKLMVELVDSLPPGIHAELLFRLCTRHLVFILAYFIETGDFLFSLILCSTYVPFLTQTLILCSRQAT